MTASLLVTAAEMGRLDRLNIEELGVPAGVLMENAGRAACSVIDRLFGPLTGRPVTVVAGTGNNGGDGFVVARLLQQAGARVRVLAVGGVDVPLAPEAAAHRRAALEAGARVSPLPGRAAAPAGTTAGGEPRLNLAPAGDGPALLVDALLGTGLKGEVREPGRSIIDAVNGMAAAGVPVVALDVPSGLDADRGVPLGAAVRASATVTFGLAKLGLVQAPAAAYTGSLHVVGIGLGFQGLRPAGRILLPHEVGARLLAASTAPGGAHKGTFGRCLIMGGARGMTGAAVLAARGALRAGAGLVTLLLPGSERHAAAFLPEVLTAILADDGEGRFHPGAASAAAAMVDTLPRGAAAVAVGPGLGRGEGAAALTAAVASACLQRGLPCLLDADALNALAAGGPGPAALKRTAAGGPGPGAGRALLVLTPHPGEAARLLGTTTPTVQADRPGAAQALAGSWGAVVVLKGARTVIAAPGADLRVSPVIDPVLAAGGTGDVLTGILTALLGCGLPPLEAAGAAVLSHGLAAALAWGDLAGQTGPGAGPRPGVAPGNLPAGDPTGAAAGLRRGVLAGETADAVPRAVQVLAAAGGETAEAILNTYGLYGFAQGWEVTAGDAGIAP